MKTNKRKKIIVMALLAAMLAVPIGLDAQTDGFFSNWNSVRSDASVSSNIDNQGFGWNNGNISNQGFGWNDGEITNQTFGEAPIGSGLLVLTVSAVGYTFLRKRDER